MKERGGFVYLLASKGRKLYCGVTPELVMRVRRHKAKLHHELHTARYNIDRLVWYQGFERIEEAIARESALKSMNRVKKIALIVAAVPEWKD